MSSSFWHVTERHPRVDKVIKRGLPRVQNLSRVLVSLDLVDGSLTKTRMF